MPIFTPEEEEFLRFQRVGILAIDDEKGLPRPIPLCHIYHKDSLYIGTEGGSWKAKRLGQEERVSFIVHEYSEDWSKLRWLRVWGKGSVLNRGREYMDAKGVLFSKYHQYRREDMWADGEDVILKVTLEGKKSWGF